MVDDDAAFAAAATRVLRTAGLEVCPAPDYRLALAELESTRRIDLLVTDIVMPERVNGVAHGADAAAGPQGHLPHCL